jgi:hypothetical protein
VLFICNYLDEIRRDEVTRGCRKLHNGRKLHNEERFKLVHLSKHNYNGQVKEDEMAVAGIGELVGGRSESVMNLSVL